ncbi:MAG: YwaF family protein [Clostridia bacterium]|nr:YwaF family protein [Clostridia bacterium]
MFSAKGTYPAVGLFTPTHIISIIICLVLIAILVFVSREISREKYFKYLRIVTIVVTIVEIFDICWSLAQGYTKVRIWLPLYFCSLYIYSLWSTWSTNKFIRDCGLSFFAMGCIVAGIAFIVFPTTSFSGYPIFHYKCIYSMLYHSAMVYTGIMLFVTRSLEINGQNVLKYILFCLVFMTLAIVLNIIFNANFMFLDNPANIPIPALFAIHNFSPILYTTVMILCHLALGPITLAIYAIFHHARASREIPAVEIDAIVVDEDELKQREI